MELSHGGQRIDCTKDPIGGAILALNASSGCGSKANAWNWANDAVSALMLQSQENADRLAEILNNSTTNFPNAAGGLEFVESLKPTASTEEATVERVIHTTGHYSNRNGGGFTGNGRR